MNLKNAIEFMRSNGYTVSAYAKKEGWPAGTADDRRHYVSKGGPFTGGGVEVHACSSRELVERAVGLQEGSAQ